MRLNKIKPTEVYRKGNFYGQVIKRSKDIPCRYCKEIILKGEEALRIEKHDGYMVKTLGISHKECFVQ